MKKPIENKKNCFGHKFLTDLIELQKSKKPKIICSGCNKKYSSKVYSDDSCETFYWDLCSQEYFCEECLENHPLKKTKNQVYFRNHQYFYNSKPVCAQCHTKYNPSQDGPLIKAWNELKYCQDCFNWNQEAAKSGVATCTRYAKDKEINCYDYLEKKSCGQCPLCLARKKLRGISTLALMTELYRNRKDFNALITWEDDGFIIRFQELMWELKQVKGWTPSKIEKAVNQDIFDKKLSQRKFSRGT